MVRITSETLAHVSAREALLDATLGPNRHQKCSQRLRDFRRPAEGLAFAMLEDDRLIGTVRLWEVSAGNRHTALLLGPLATDPTMQGRGLGSTLMHHALGRAAALGHKAVMLVGDYPFYRRFGFSPDLTEQLVMPGPYDPGRFLGLELVPRALAEAKGRVTPKCQLDHLEAFAA